MVSCALLVPNPASAVRRLLAAASLAVLILAASATAVPITASFSGTITDVPDPLALLDPSIVVGSPFVVTYTFDEDDIEFTQSDDPVVGAIFYHMDPDPTMEATVQGLAFSTIQPGCSSRTIP